MFSSHHNTGVAISDTTVRFITLAQKKIGMIPVRYGEMPVPEGCIKEGMLADSASYIRTLKAFRAQHKLRYVRIALPPQLGTTILVSIKKDTPNISKAINTVLAQKDMPADISVAGYKVVAVSSESITFAVHTVLRTVVFAYTTAFRKAGFLVTGVVLNGSATTRALLRPERTCAIMTVTIDPTITVLTVAIAGNAVQQTTLPFGGMALITALMHAHNMTPIEAHEHLAQENALATNNEYFAVVAETLDTLVDEIHRTNVRWQQKKGALGIEHSIDRIELSGQYASTGLLDEYIQSRVRISTVVGNPWEQCFSFDAYIPMLMWRDAHQYSSAIGLALGPESEFDLLPEGDRLFLERRHAFYRALAIFLVTTIAVAAGFIVALLLRW